jgi:hypothetical protein
MRYVILRDDDTNALTPISCLERLYRPFLDRGMSVNLAVIPEVRTRITLPDGRQEGFLQAKNGTQADTLPIAANPELVAYLKANPGFRVVQHGCHHDYFEFDRPDRGDVARRLDHGTNRLLEAGFQRPKAFVAPYDKISRVGMEELAKRFQVVSTGWFELQRVPTAWWPRYALKKLRKRPHWRTGQTCLLSHPGCLLSYHRPYAQMLDRIRAAIDASEVTVLVTHWWEYFRDGEADEPFIEVLHETAEMLAARRDVRVVSFDEVPDLVES